MLLPQSLHTRPNASNQMHRTGEDAGGRVLQGAVELQAQLREVCSWGASCCILWEEGMSVEALPCVPALSPDLEHCVYHKGKESGLDKPCCNLWEATPKMSKIALHLEKFKKCCLIAVQPVLQRSAVPPQCVWAGGSWRNKGLWVCGQEPGVFQGVAAREAPGGPSTIPPALASTTGPSWRVLGLAHGYTVAFAGNPPPRAGTVHPSLAWGTQKSPRSWLGPLHNPRLGGGHGGCQPRRVLRHKTLPGDARLAGTS